MQSMTKDQKHEETKPNLNNLEQRIQELEAALEKASLEVDEARSLQLRALADLQNFQRREAENKKNWSSIAIADFMTHLLPRLVELRMAEDHTSDEHVKKTIDHFFKTLEKAGFLAIIPKKGDQIDTTIHEIVMAEEGEKGTVVQCFEHGWKYGSIILKPAKVSSPAQ